MKAPGIERNREIAKKRGKNKCIHDERPEGLPPEANITDMCDSNSIAWPTHCHEDFCLTWQIKPYSTDIATAMELWEEMFEVESTWELRLKKYCSGTAHPNQGLFVSTVLKKRAWEEMFEIVKFISEPNSSSGGSAADAISGAWLKWKSDD